MAVVTLISGYFLLKAGNLITFAAPESLCLLWTLKTGKSDFLS